ncbi:DUF397 domain-containing protein [Streptomyces sp. x-19]|uniref:DUF397 domain-containing protein n=1 Tax=Streptomyces sp. x-19 TaxID=2789280 RepID=UPI00397FB162
MKPEVIGVFRKSSYSNQDGACVEIAPTSTGGRAIRDSKNPAGPHLAFPADAWSAFAQVLKGGGRT